MDYVNLGQTGLKVSRICLGMMTYGTSQWRPWILDEADARPIVQRAVELGVNFFDQAGRPPYKAGKLFKPSAALKPDTRHLKPMICVNDHP